MNRRFLNLVLRCTGGRYSLHHLDTWRHLFYESAAAASAAATRKKGIFEQEQRSSLGGIPVLERVPAPAITFQPFQRHYDHHVWPGADVFAPFGGEGSKVVFVDGVGHTTVYDTAARSVQGMPTMNARGGVVLPSIPGTESLYVMDMAPDTERPCFQALSCSSDGWLWRPLPSPPFLQDPCFFNPRWGLPSAVVDRNTIYVSPTIVAEEDGTGIMDMGIGTYAFNTVTQLWRKAGDWVVPFEGNGEHVPEVGLWVGLWPHEPHDHLCAVGSFRRPPAVQYVWQDFDTPEHWLPIKQHLVYLGLGRFCTARFFDALDVPYNDDACNDVAVFTGVELVGCDDQPGGLKMIRHKSRSITGVAIADVL